MPDGTTAIFTHFAVCLHHHNPRGAAAGNFDIDARHELALRGGYAVICSRDPWSAYLVSNQPPAYSKLMMLMNYGVNCEWAAGHRAQVNETPQLGVAGCGRVWLGVAGFGWVWLGLAGFGWV